MPWVNPATAAPTDYGQIPIPADGSSVQLTGGIAIWISVIWIANDDDNEQMVRIVDGTNVLYPGEAIPAKKPWPLEIPFMPAANPTAQLVTPPGKNSAGLTVRVLGYPQ